MVQQEELKRGINVCQPYEMMVLKWVTIERQSADLLGVDSVAGWVGWGSPAVR